ncbi:GDSL esterase/lipase [Dorcoceras hygrometricum]|uniref:GDSL esterase/lipase n=1 Tax=Dorcoceras hygrometricum TaxID=472368 RepID=A0A2Z7AGP7_9LAMI|nr:GDSL esterase/lipase [Dorcoceras hygrometricum]
MAYIRIPTLVCLFLSTILGTCTSADGTPPPIFVLGDSTADVGTNSHMPQSRARANFLHNGIDFPHSRPTGRFSNGFNSADFLGKKFGLKRSPEPFLSLLTLGSRFKKHLLKGVNFASGGAGLLDVTGSNLTVIPLSQQIAQFSTVRDNLTALIGHDETDKLLCRSLFFISTGSNDIFGYFVANSTIPKSEFINILISAYSDHIVALYNLGARKFGIISIPPVGCCPSQRLRQKAVNGVDDCFNPMNDLALDFHSALDNLLGSLTTGLPGFKYSLGNAFRMTMDVIRNPQPFGFENVESACCGSGHLNAQGICNRTASLCPDRRTYLFWDLFHPTMKASSLAADTLYSGPPIYVSPINFSQLADNNNQ